MTPAQREALELYESGLSIVQVGIKLGISQEAAYYRLQRASYTPRKKWRKQFCVRGHDTFVIGRDRKRTCNLCAEVHADNNRYKRRAQAQALDNARHNNQEEQ